TIRSARNEFGRCYEAGGSRPPSPRTRTRLAARLVPPAMRLLITGVGGVVGGHLGDLLRGEDPQGEVFGRERPHGVAPAGLAGGVTTFEADFDDAGAVGCVIETVKPDRVVHLAGQSSVQHSWMDPGGTLRTNVLGLVHVMDALVERGLQSRVL